MSESPTTSSSQPSGEAPSPSLAGGTDDAAVEIFCPHCGYNLRGLNLERCPECGKTFSPDELRQSQLPWTHRARIGRHKAFWRTVRMVTFRPSRFCREIARPADHRDAQKFRWLVIAHVLAALLILGLGLLAIVLLDPQGMVKPGVLILVAIIAGYFLLALPICTGIPSWFCAPKSLEAERQNRAIALSYYSAGPLAYLYLPAIGGLGVLIALSYYSSSSSFSSSGLFSLDLILSLLGILTVLLAGVLLLFWLIGTLVTTCKLSQRSAAGASAITLAVPLLWIILPLTLIGTLAGAAMYWTLMYYSLT